MGFTLYTTKTCGFCPMVKKFLDNKNAKYKTVDVTDDYETRLSLQTKYQAQTVPILVREDGEYMIGFNLPKLTSML